MIPIALTSAQAEVRVVPNLRGFQEGVRSSISRMRVNPIRIPVSVVTERAVQGMRSAMTQVQRFAETAGRRVAESFTKHFPRSAAALNDFARGFRQLDTHALASANRIQRLGYQARQVFDGAARPVQNFVAGLRNSDAAASAFTGRMGSLGGVTRRVFDSAARPIQNFVSGFRDSNAAASAFSGRMGTLGGVARRAVGGVQGAFTSLAGGVRNVGTRISETLRNGIQAPMSGIAAQASGLVAAIGLGGMGTAALQAAQNIQNTQLTLNGLYGSAEVSGDMMERLKRISRDSPIEYQAYARGATQLAYMGYEGEQAEKILTNVGAAITAVGGSSEGMDRATSAMLGMINSGKVYAAQLNQISDSGIPIWSALSDAMYGTTDRVADVREQVTQGAVSIDQVMKAIEDGSGATFQSMLAASDEVSKSMSNQWKIFKDNFVMGLAEMLLPLVQEWAPKVGQLGETIGSALQTIPDRFREVQQVARDWGVMDALERFGTMVADLGRGALPFFKNVLTGIGIAFGAVLIALQPLFDLFAALGRWLQENGVAARTLGIVFGVLTAVLIAQKIATAGLSLVMMGLRPIILGVQIATWLWNSALLANPITWVVIAIAALVAAIIYAWNNFDWFRNAVLAVWDFLKGVGSWIATTFVAAWDGLVAGLRAAGNWISTVFVAAWDALKVAFEAVGNALMWVWNTLIKPVFDALRTVALMVFQFLVAVIIGPLILLWEALGAAFRWVYDSILAPVFRAFAAIGQWLFHNVLVPVFNGIRTAWNALMTAFRWIYDSILVPLFNAFRTIAQWLYQNVLVPIFNGIRTAWDALLTAFKWIYDSILVPLWNAFRTAVDFLYRNVLQPIFRGIEAAWDGLAAAFKWIYDNIINPIWGIFERAAQTFRDSFDRIVGAVISIWERLREGFKAPVRFVIDTVWNNGIGGLYAKAKDLIPALPDFKRVDLPAGFRRGGPVRGPGTSTSDSIPARLSDGEHVLTAREVEAAGGHRAVMQWRQSLLTETHPLHRAGGGPVTWQDLWAGIRGAFPGARLTSAVRRTSDYHGRGKAVDVAGPRPMDMPFMLRMNQWAANHWGAGLAELIHTQPGAINLKNGRGHTYSAGIQADHRDHVHIAAGGGGLGSMIGGVIDGAFNWIADQMRSLWDTMAGPILAGVDAAFPGGTFAERLPKDMTRSVMDALRDKLFGDAGDVGGGGEPGTGPVVDQVRAVAARYGWDQGAQWNALSRLISNESSWIPTNANPNSTAYGLFQFLNSTWGTVGATKTSNPGLQAEAGLRYIQQRYRDPIGAMSFWNRNRWYDSGGWLKPGITGVMNRTGQPEAVLTNTQWQVAADAMNEVRRGRDLDRLGLAKSAESGRKGPLFGDVHVHERVDVDHMMDRAAFLSGNL